MIQRLINFVGGEIRPPVAGGREIRLVVVDVEGDGFQLEPRAPVMQHPAEAPGADTAEQRLARGCVAATNRPRRRRNSCITASASDLGWGRWTAGSKLGRRNPAVCSYSRCKLGLVEKCCTYFIEWACTQIGVPKLGLV